MREALDRSPSFQVLTLTPPIKVWSQARTKGVAVLYSKRSVITTGMYGKQCSIFALLCEKGISY